MGQSAVDYFTFTEVGGVGEMVYKAVRFPEYVPEYNHATKEDEIKPLFTALQKPTSEKDYHITGQGILANLCNLYKKINAPDFTGRTDYEVWNWCRDNIHPYNIEDLCTEIENGDFFDAYFLERLQHFATFEVKTFISDLIKLGTAYEYYYVLQRIKYRKDVTAGRELYYEGRICDSMPFLEKYRQYTIDAEYLKHFNEDYNELFSNVLDMLPDFKMRVKQNPKTYKAEMCAEIHSVFDIAWYTFARMISDVAPPIDVDMDLDYEYSEGSVLTCMACGNYFVRRSSRQRYCDDPDCQAERNRRKSRAYYMRKQANEQK